MRRLVGLAALLALSASPAVAQAPVPSAPAEPSASAPTPAPAAAESGGDFIIHHVTDNYWLELPSFRPPFVTEVCLGKHVGEHDCVSPIADFHIGPITGNLWPTKHTVMLALAAALVVLLLLLAGRASRRQTAAQGYASGFAGAIESVVLYIRNEVILPNVGHHGEPFVPYLLAIFFFILGANLLGMIPFAATASGNIAVTATLAIITFFVIEISGLVANGFGYLNTIIYWNRELPLYMRVPLALIVSPIEVFGKFTKPFALAIRLFANMTAGHIVILALVGLIFTFGSWIVAPAPVLAAVAIYFLELLVAFLQAFIFTMLASVFIGQIREAHH